MNNVVLAGTVLGYLVLRCGFSRESVGLERYADALSSIFLPALGFPFVLAACANADELNARRSYLRRLIFSPLLVAGVAVAYSFFSYNRAAIVVPLLGLFAAFTVHRHVTVKAVLLGGVMIAAFAFVLGSVRPTPERCIALETSQPPPPGRDQSTSPVVVIGQPSSSRSEPSGAAPSGGPTSSPSEPSGAAPSGAPKEKESPTIAVAVDVSYLDVNRQLQIYGSAPQYTAFMLDGDRGKRFYAGMTLLASILYPLPVVGRDLRPLSGVVIYNHDIYGTEPALDQVVPFTGELFWNFSLPGVVVGFVLLGFAIEFLDRAYRQATSAVDAHMASYAAIWLTFLVIGSVAVVSQVAFYFMWPFGVLIAWRSLRRRRGQTSRQRA